MERHRRIDWARVVGVVCPVFVFGHGSVVVGQYTPEVIAYSGQGVDARSVFQLFDDPVINDDGNIVFWAWESIDTPENDECTGAIDISLGTTTLGNHFATSTAEPSWCGLNDVWLRFTAASSMPHQLYGFLCVGTTNIYPGLAVYSGTCGNLQLVAENCNTTLVNFTPVAGQVYYIRAGARPQPNQPARWTVTIDLRDSAPGSYYATPRSHQRGLWIVGADGVPRPIVREGMVTAFDPELSYRSSYFPALGPGENIALLAATRGNSMASEITRASLVRSAEDGTLQQVLRDGAPPDLLWLSPIPQLNEDGRLAYTLNNGLELTYGSQVVVAGAHAPGTPEGVTFQLIDQPVSSAGMPIAFRARLQGTGVTDSNNLGLWVDRGSGLDLLARTGDPAPGTEPGVVWKEVAIEPAVTDVGLFALFATLDGPGITPDNNAGIWVGASGNLRLAARVGSSAPGVPGAAFASLRRQVRINRAGNVLIGAALGGEGIDATNNTGLWLVGDGTGTLVARESQQVAPSHPGVLLDNFFDPVLDDFGNVLVTARVRGETVGPANNELLLAIRGSSRRVIIRSGDAVELPTMESKVVKRAVFGDWGAGAGRAVANHSREIVYRLVFTDGSEAVCRAADLCFADWDGNGVVNSNDFFAFVVDFFAGRADVNADGATTAQDFYDYLAAFFTACE